MTEHAAISDTGRRCSASGDPAQDAAAPDRRRRGALSIAAFVAVLILLSVQMLRARIPLSAQRKRPRAVERRIELNRVVEHPTIPRTVTR